MGAFGAALIARERYDGSKTTTMLSIDKILGLTYETNMARCQGCTNHCVLTINRFDGGRQFVTGNRCERGLGGRGPNVMFPIFLNINTTECSILNH